MRLLLVWLLNAIALIGVAYIVPGIRVDTFTTALIAALVLGLVNTIIRPILVVLTLPVTVLTLGLFLFVINGLLFWAVGSFLKGFHVDGFLIAVLGAVVYSVIGWVLSLLLPKKA
jgi:putative membrane protein